MGDMSAFDGAVDWGTEGVGAQFDPGSEVATIGAGGDPYSDAPPDTSSPETADTGILPGGPDAQLGPWSPQGGFDFTNVVAGTSALLRGAGTAQVRPVWWAGGGARQGGSFFGGGSGRMPSIAGGPGSAVNPRGPNLGVMSSAQQAGMITRSIRDATGLRVSAKSIVGLIVRYGFGGAQALTGAQPSDLLFLFMREKGVRHHRRGPGLYTIAKKLRAADRLRHTVRRMLGKFVGYHHHQRAPSRKKKGKR